MKKITHLASTLVAISFFLLPTVSAASTLTSGQASAIVGLLQAFGVASAIVSQVEQILGLSPSTPTPPVTPQPLPPHISTVGSPYSSSNLGYDISFATTQPPSALFNFSIVGVTKGKAFIDNPRFTTQFSWAKFGSNTPPTIYMNINAPYGSTVAGNVSSPMNCPASGTVGAEPTACQGYNYGYNAAQHSYAYAKSNGTNSAFWWLDVEEANSWSLDLSVNDATIQGAIDYLNTQGVRVGIYSMQYMWNNIAGNTFAPTQKLNGQVVLTPSWLPIGIDDLIGAINSCVTRSSFMPGNPIWLIQYVSDSTAVDQNLAC